MEQMREKRKVKPTKKLRSRWKDHIKDETLPEDDRYEIVKEDARRIESSALNKEKVLTSIKGQMSVDETIEVGDLLVDAINAKMALLDEIK